jgi:hypothetical protein
MVHDGRIDSVPGVPQPVGELRLQIPVTQPDGLVKDWFGDLDHRRRVAPQGGLFAPRGGNWADPLQLIYLLGHLPRLLEELGGTCLATPDPYRRQDCQRDAAGGWL